jgi:triacylglycerol lipase
MRFRDLLREARFVGELATFASDTLLGGRSSAPAQTPKSVMLIPGFMVGDATLYPLAGRLKLSGYPVFFAGIWCNAICPATTMRNLQRTLHRASRASGGRVVVIGHSLGGIYARELGRHVPDLVERVVLLGAPLKHAVENTALPVRALAAVMEIAHKNCLSSFGDPCPTCGVDLPASPPGVPETIIYTKSDGIVDWRSCVEEGENVEAIEVRSSHCGLSVSTEAWQVIADRLEQESSGTRNHTRCGDGKHSVFRCRPSYLRLVKRPASAA